LKNFYPVEVNETVFSTLWTWAYVNSSGLHLFHNLDFFISQLGAPFHNHKAWRRILMGAVK